MRAIRKEMRGLAQPELTVAQFRVLTRLDYAPHTNKQLAEWMGISAASMSKTVDGLVKRSFIQRSESASDRREVTLVLTVKGKKKYENIKAGTQELLFQRIVQLEDHEKQELMLGLAHLRKIFL